MNQMKNVHMVFMFFEELHHVVTLTGDDFVKPIEIIKKSMSNEKEELIKLAESKIISMTQLKIKAKNNYGLTISDKKEEEKINQQNNFYDSDDEKPKKIKK